MFRFLDILLSRRTIYTVFELGIALLCMVAVAYSIVIVATPKAHASAGDNLSGWAWSENVGWISFNSTNCDTDDNGVSNGGTGCPAAGTQMGEYGVNVASDGTMSGYAWSEHIGWISFNAADLAGCPSSGCTAALNKTTGAVSGWARACAGTINGNCTGGSRTDGWDGWIRLSGDGYGVAVSGCAWGGWAWGSDVLGWIHMSDMSTYGVTGTGNGCLKSLTVSITADPTAGTPPLTVSFQSVVSGGAEPYQFSWQFGDGGASTNQSPAHVYTDFGAYTATLTVTDSAGATAQASIVITVKAPPPQVTLTANPNFISIGGSSQLTWQVHWGSLTPGTCQFQSNPAADAGSSNWYAENGAGNTSGDQISVKPQSTITYQIICTDANGSMSATARVTVSQILEPTP